MLFRRVTHCGYRSRTVVAPTASLVFLLGGCWCQCRAMSTGAVRTKELQTLWSTSYDAWINVPQHDEPVVYLRPLENENTHCPITTTTTPMTNTRSLPAILYDDDLTLFALTGYNPMGEDQPMAVNVAANEQLRRDIDQLQDPPPRYVWSAFGFSPQWREAGYVIAYHRLDRTAGEAAVIALAVQYRQGAIFGFDVLRPRQRDTTTSTPTELLLRRTIPAAMANVEADVVMMPCEKPEGMANAEYVVLP